MRPCPPPPLPFVVQVQWWKSDKVSFDIDTAWDQRMRLDLAERYDARKNMIDWDYHMGLGDLGPLVKFQEYRYFRNTAIAYDKDLIDPAKDGKAVYEHVNRSLLHFDRKVRARCPEAALFGGIGFGFVVEFWWKRKIRNV